MDEQFEIKLLNINWIGNLPDDGRDLCAHGKVYLRIGTTILSDDRNQDWTVSATALFLLRTLNIDYHEGDFYNFLLPCCGHSLVKEKNKPLIISGCNTGIDWNIQHLDNGLVKHFTKDGIEGIIQEEHYKKQIYDFSDRVENFYNKSKKRRFYDKYDKKAYQEFKREWNELR
jgi:hypothetical protein